ncbi:hypothetical protein LIER_00406 [Lithospermum erythrorhizon]|uniref:Uncharacterized protein n=1 Tax=Lithospermum erythrorhizon TaxID=34254 RepID=A0AAV3NHB0_LITER
MRNVGFELVRRANSLDFENQQLLAQVPSEKEASLEEELTKLKEDLAKSERINSSILTEKSKLNEDYLGLHKREGVKELQEESAELQNTLLAAVEKFKESKEFKAALSTAVESFKTSPEFLDALGANSAYGAFSFVKKYKEKYPELRSDYAEFQKDYKSSWFADLDLDASSSEEKDEEDASPAGDVPPPA